MAVKKQTNGHPQYAYKAPANTFNREEPGIANACFTRNARANRMRISRSREDRNTKDRRDTGVEVVVVVVVVAAG